MPAFAQSEKEAGKDDDIATLEQVSVVGSQIKGANSSALLPIETLTAEKIESIGAVSGDELYRNIPQMGDVSFTGNGGGNSSNFARGDVASVDLRGLGVGNTLLLINGRRTVTHPQSQADDNLVPVLSYNANAIPVANVERVEVLLGGASAIYGADAVAGVVNNVLRDDVDGGHITVQSGAGEGTDLRDYSLSGVIGKNFGNLRGNVTLAFSLLDSTGLTSQDQDWTSTADRRSYFADTAFADDNSLDNTSTTSKWGSFSAGQQVTQDGVAITSSAGAFHIQPSSNSGCNADIDGSVCIDSGSKSSTGADRNLRTDAGNEYPTSISPELKRLNLFLTSKYDFDNGISFFSEFGLYHSQSKSLQTPVNSTSSLVVTVPASNYWNPFGATYLPDGSVNPNRLSGLNVSEDGIPVTISTYRFERPTQIEVTNTQVRALAGLRGQKWGFDWESALLYSRAKVRDQSDGVSMTKLQESLARSDESAYNPFCGGCNSDEVLDSIYVQAVRKSITSLTQWDFKISRPDLFRNWAGDIGMAGGLEVRHETQEDNRDPRVDGTIVYTDSVTGESVEGDLYGVSSTPDVYGSRTVGSLYTEFTVPLVSEEMSVPLVRSLDLQLAGRSEHYSDFGSVTKPKIALGWEVAGGFKLRGSWSQGFKAPNLEQTNISVLARANTRTDYIQCEADLRTGAISSFSDCTHSASTTGRRYGNPDLKPETSENASVGFSWTPNFIPSEYGSVSLSMDYFKYNQKNIIGVFGEGNALILDYVLRVQGSSNPNVVRDDPTADQIERFEGTGLEAAGTVLYVNDQYINLQPQTVRGLDYSASWLSPETAAGQFVVSLNATRLIEFYREPSDDIQTLLDARAAGIINADTTISGYGNLIGQDGNPRWRAGLSLTWHYKQITVGASARYVGTWYDTDLQYDDGSYYKVKAYTTGNMFFRYAFNSENWLRDTSFKIGVNNVANKRPPDSDDTYGYNSSLYSATPRYWYMAFTKQF